MYTLDKSSAKEKNRIFCEVFGSVNEFSGTIRKRDPNPIMTEALYGRGQSDFKDDCAVKFSGTKNLAEADNLLNKGDSELAGKIADVSAKLEMESNADDTKFYKKTIKSVCGGFPIVPLHIIGVPCNMMAQRKITRRKPVVNIVANPSVAGNIEADVIIKAGALLLSAINLLEKNGIRVGIYASSFASYRAPQKKGGGLPDIVLRIGYLIKLKEPDAPLVLQNIAYSLAHPSFLRRHGFLYKETIPADLKGIDKYYLRGYGAPMASEEVIKYLPQRELREAFTYDFSDYIKGGTDVPMKPEELAKKIIHHFEAK